MSKPIVPHSKPSVSCALSVDALRGLEQRSSGTENIAPSMINFHLFVYDRLCRMFCDKILSGAMQKFVLLDIPC